MSVPSIDHRLVKAYADAVATNQLSERVLERVDLAHAPDFGLGDLIVRPSTREVEAPSGVHVLEPRVMQVLVTLHQAAGKVVSREDLTVCCWEGRVVGEDAINRVLSRLRRIADELGPGSFRVETITKVGYRLIVGEGAPGPAGHQPQAAAPHVPAGRRGVLVGLASAGGLAALGLGAWIARPGRGAADPRVEELLSQASFAMNQDTPEGQNQAIGLYRRAIAIQPDNGDAWGSLAVTYAFAAQWRASREGPALRARAIDCARQAAQLRPDNGFSAVALAVVKSVRGHWLACERALVAASEKHPDSDLLAFALACLRCTVGRAREAAAMLASLRAGGEGGPGPYYRGAMALWASGQLDAADRLLKEARELYPTHFALWFTDCYIRLYTGRANASIAMIEDVDTRPTGIPPDEFDAILQVAKGLVSRDPRQIDAAMDLWLDRAHRGAGYAENAIQFATALGRIDTAFAIAEAYYFGRGFVVPEVRFTVQQGSYTPLADRQTAFLFNGSLGAFRADPRFARLTEELGLKAYWAASGTRPDFLT